MVQGVGGAHAFRLEIERRRCTDERGANASTSSIAPILADLGLELYDLDHAGGVLRVVVDRPGGVDIDAIADATRLDLA